MTLKNITVLVSGGGTNLQSLIDAAKRGEIPVRIGAVISDTKDAFALERARQAGIFTATIDKRDKLTYPTKEAFDAAILMELQNSRPDLIVLAGFLSILPRIVTDKYKGRIINIHPSLIPKYCGKGFYGHKVHEAVLAGGDKESGATVHFVDDGIDTGRIILQQRVLVKDGDTPELLAARVLSAEHRILPQAIKILCKEINMRRAIISVSDKTGVANFAKALAARGYEIISTGGTAALLRAEGIATIEAEDVTGFPECLDGRVKTLHPKIHGGILAIRDDKEHIETLKKLSISPIDLICVNLYPFKKTVEKEGHTLSEAIENIDIGGPSMLRAGAKNYRFVTVVTEPADYDMVLSNMDEKGDIPEQMRFSLAAKAFAHTAAYDAHISRYLADAAGSEKFPDQLTLTFEKKQDLRYGENPHQQAAYYLLPQIDHSTVGAAEFLHGKELSYNNIGDADGAVAIVKDFELPCCVAVKHANPCAVAIGDDVTQAYSRAFSADPVSIFGGILAFNRTVDAPCAAEINKTFIEIVIAPDFTKEALEILKTKKNLRILKLPGICDVGRENVEFKNIEGGLLVQDKDYKEKEGHKVVTQKSPSQSELADLDFAMKVCKHVKSNAVVIAKDGCTVGIGGGSVSRIWAAKAAIERADEFARGAVLASDAFFPFEDVVWASAKAGITAIVQPGGSVNDNRSVIACDEAEIAMIFTGVRHFKH